MPVLKIMKKMISYLHRELRRLRSVSEEDNALFFVCFIFSLHAFPATVRPFPSQAFLLRIRDKMLIKTRYSRHARSGLAERRVK